jgi:hypothetical protein
MRKISFVAAIALMLDNMASDILRRADSRCCRLRRVRLAHGICVHTGHERCAARECEGSRQSQRGYTLSASGRSVNRRKVIAAKRFSLIRRAALRRWPSETGSPPRNNVSVSASRRNGPRVYAAAISRSSGSSETLKKFFSAVS